MVLVDASANRNKAMSTETKQSINEIKQFHEELIDKVSQQQTQFTNDRELAKKLKLIENSAQDVVEYIKKRSER